MQWLHALEFGTAYYLAESAQTLAIFQDVVVGLFAGETVGVEGTRAGVAGIVARVAAIIRGREVETPFTGASEGISVQLETEVAA